MMEVVVTTGAMKRSKLQSNRHQQQTTYRRLDALPPTVCSVRALYRAICADVPLGTTRSSPVARGLQLS